MNPNDCHQAVLLKKQLPNYNFLEASRSGVSFIEALEISKQLDSLKPIYNLIYVSSADFYESVSSILPSEDITQLNIEKGEVVYGKMKSPGLKKILYNWKLLYYFYNRFPLNSVNSQAKSQKEEKTGDEFIYKNELKSLMAYIKQHYNINNKILVFHPDTENIIIEICKNSGFKVIVLNSDNDESWTFDNDIHWTCYGHSRVAIQIQKFLNQMQD
jgi:hypothetical protein